MNDTRRFSFRLFVAGEAGNSVQAIANLAALCRDYLPDRHTLEVVDVFMRPECALADGVFMTPTLIRVEPTPERRIVGTLSQTAVVLRTLGVDSLPA